MPNSGSPSSRANAHEDRFFLRKETRAWNLRANRDHVTIQWSFICKQARHKFGYKITRSRY